MKHVVLRKKFAVSAVAGLFALGLGAATASSASATEIRYDIRPSGEISSSALW